MNADLNDAPLFLLVEAGPQESDDDLFESLRTQYEPRHNDPEWGPLYQVGPKYALESKTFYQIQTYAGSLATRMMFAVKKGELDRSVLFKTDDENGFQLFDPAGNHRNVGEPVATGIESKG